MFHPFFAQEVYDSKDEYPLERFLDDFIATENHLRGDLGEFSSFDGLYPENPIDSDALINELLNSQTPTENISKRNRPCSIEEERRLSTEEVMRVAAALFIQTSSLIVGDPTKLKLPFGLSLSSIRADEAKSIELATLLLTAAEKVSNEQYNHANALLKQIDTLSSKFGTAVQRVVHYFADALQERIDPETGNLGQKEMEAMTPNCVINAVLTGHPLMLVATNTIPFAKVLQFTAMQAHLDNVASAEKIHVIDLCIKYGSHWTVFLQGLATRSSLCPIKSIKISAVGATEELIVATGKRLSSFAESLSLPFKFKPVIVSNVKELRESMFEIERGETVGIYSSMYMNYMIIKPESLDNLMRVLQKLKPCIVTVTDVEANHNSPSFINRFSEALFFYSAYFDCIDSLMEKTDENRLLIESFFSQGIKSTIASEGIERVVRLVGVGVWRAFFRRYGLREADLSEWSMYQARLLIKQFVEDESCTLEMNGKALLIGWKGTPLHFVSAWKFSQEEVSVPTFNEKREECATEEQES